MQEYPPRNFGQIDTDVVRHRGNIACAVAETCKQMPRTPYVLKARQSS